MTLDEKIEKTFGEAYQYKTLTMDLFDDAYKHVLPSYSLFYSKTVGTQNAFEIYNDAPRVALSKYKEKLSSWLTPSWSTFIKFKPGYGVPSNQIIEVQRYLDGLEKVFFMELAKSNFYVETLDGYQELGISQACLKVMPSKKEGKSLHFENIPLYQYYIDPRNYKNIFVVHKLDRPDLDPVQHLTHSWGDYNAVEVAYHEGNVVHHRLYSKEWKLIEADVVKNSPFITFREATTPGEAYGNGRILQKISSVRILNNLTKDLIAQSNFLVNPPIITTDRDIANSLKEAYQPGDTLYAKPGTTTTALNLATPNFELAIGEIQRYEENVNKFMFGDPFGLPEDTKYQTATGMLLRQNEQIINASGTFTRLRHEFIDPLIERILEIFFNKGIVKYPLSINGLNIELDYKFPLSRQQDLEDIANIERLMGILIPLGVEALNAGIKIEDLPQELALKLDIKANLIRTPQERAQIIQAAIMQAQQQQEQNQQGEQNG